MALSGVHVLCGYVGARGDAGKVVDLFGKMAWSQTMASAGTTTEAAPAGNGTPSFEVRASLDIYVAVGPTPNAAVSPRMFVPAGETRNVFCAPGDKLAWLAA